MKKMYVIIIIIENLLLILPKFWIIASHMLAAFLDDYMIPLTAFQKIFTFSKGIVIAIGLDFLVNFIISKIINRKDKIITYKKLVIYSLIITILEIIFILSL